MRARTWLSSRRRTLARAVARGGGGHRCETRRSHSVPGVHPFRPGPSRSAVKDSSVGFMLRRLALVAFVVVAGLRPARADDDEKVDFRRQILPIFEGACVDCHGLKKASGG